MRWLLSSLLVSSSNSLSGLSTKFCFSIFDTDHLIHKLIFLYVPFLKSPFVPWFVLSFSISLFCEKKVCWNKHFPPKKSLLYLFIFSLFSFLLFLISFFVHLLYFLHLSSFLHLLLFSTISRFFSFYTNFSQIIPSTLFFHLDHICFFVICFWTHLSVTFFLLFFSISFLSPSPFLSLS